MDQSELKEAVDFLSQIAPPAGIIVFYNEKNKSSFWKQTLFEMPYYHTLTISAAFGMYAWNTRMTYYICQNLINIISTEAVFIMSYYHTTPTMLQYAV